MDFYSKGSSCLFRAVVCMLLAGLTAGCETTTTQLGVAKSALVPPPPVNQNIGFPDIAWNDDYPMPANCLACHDKEGTGNPDEVSDAIALRHHMMLDPTSPRHKAQYECQSCHQPDGQGAMSVTINCRECHKTSPHHKSVPAKERHCNACHGSVINNFDDGHYIPGYKPSIVTPHPQCRVFGPNGECQVGGCRACHIKSDAVTPNIWSNVETHHGTGLGQGDNDPAQCGWCHTSTDDPGAPAINMRTCETCHGPTSIHSIEFQYDTNKGTAGYGHIGADFDCWGCHGFYKKYSLPPMFGPTVPSAESASVSSVAAGVATEICLAGQSFTNSVVEQNKAYTPVVVVSPLDPAYSETASQVLTPTSFTEGAVCVNASLPAGAWNFRVVKDYQGSKQVKSNGIAVVARSVAITSASLSGSTLTLTGNGFGGQQPSWGRVLVNAKACTITSWTNTQIVATCSGAKSGDRVVVIAGGGGARANVVNQ
jgi:hypothetical protein